MMRTQLQPSSRRASSSSSSRMMLRNAFPIVALILLVTVLITINHTLMGIQHNRQQQTNNNNNNKIQVQIQERGEQPAPRLHDVEKEKKLATIKKGTSQVGQDKCLLSMMDNPYGDDLFYVDIGSNDPIKISNTYILDHKFRWRGICVEPQKRFVEAYKKHRTCAHIRKAISSNESVAFVERGDPGFSGIAGYDNPLGSKFKTLDATTLRSLFEDYAVPYDIAYMSVDVEGYELEVFKTFPFDSHRVRYMTVERPSKKLNNLLIAKGYCILHNGAKFKDIWYAHREFKIPQPDKKSCAMYDLPTHLSDPSYKCHP